MVPRKERGLWERGYVLSLNDVTIPDISSFMNERYYFKLFEEFLDTSVMRKGEWCVFFY